MSRILYVQTSGVETPERLYAPFILGTTARAMEVEASIFFMIKGITAMKKGEAEKIKIGSFPSLKDVIDQALAARPRECRAEGFPKSHDRYLSENSRTLGSTGELD